MLGILTSFSDQTFTYFNMSEKKTHTKGFMTQELCSTDYI